MKSQLALLIAFIGSVTAQTSLYIPGFDPQPISADILGVDGDGHTTWALHQGALTGTFDDASFPGTATLVEGPDDASFTYVDPAGAFTMGTDCSLSNGLAICSAILSGEVVIETERADFIIVQAGTTATFSTATGATPTPTPTFTSVVSQLSAEAGSSAQTSENTSSAPSPTETSNGRVILPPVISGLLFSAAISLALQ